MGRIGNPTIKNLVYGIGSAVILLSIASGDSRLALGSAVAGTAIGWYDQKIDQDVIGACRKYLCRRDVV